MFYVIQTSYSDVVGTENYEIIEANTEAEATEQAIEMLQQNLEAVPFGSFQDESDAQDYIDNN